MAPQLVVIATAVRRISSSHWRHWRPQSSPPAPAGKVQRHPSASDVTTKTHTTTTTTTTRALATSTAAVVVATVSSAASYYYGDGGNRHPEDTTTTITEDRLTATSASSVFLALWNRHFLTSVARTQCQEVATSAPTLKLSQPQKISSSISSKIQRKVSGGHFVDSFCCFCLTRKGMLFCLPQGTKLN